MPVVGSGNSGVGASVSKGAGSSGVDSTWLVSAGEGSQAAGWVVGALGGIQYPPLSVQETSKTVDKDSRVSRLSQIRMNKYR